jgi:hypothetical protein
MSAQDNRPIAFGHVTFCDDIRLEQGGKVTLVGVYPNSMFVHGQFPFQLPKFGMLVSYSQRLDAPRGPVELQIFLPGDPDDAPTIKGDLAMDDVVGDPDLAKRFERPGLPAVKYAHVGMHIVSAPMILKSEGQIRVVAIREGGEIRLGSLRVMQAPDATGAASEPSAPSVAS